MYFFMTQNRLKRNFEKFGLVEYREIDEPVKHLENEEPMKFWMMVCRKAVVCQ